MDDLQKKLFSVADLAKLGSVGPATVRRWRTDGLNGIKLVPYFEEKAGAEKQQNKYLMFSKENVRKFAQQNPRIMTEALRAALVEQEPAVTPPGGGLKAEEVISKVPFNELSSAKVTLSEKNQYYYKLLCAREAELQRELEYVRKERAELEKP